MKTLYTVIFIAAVIVLTFIYLFFRWLINTGINKAFNKAEQAVDRASDRRNARNGTAVVYLASLCKRDRKGIARCKRFSPDKEEIMTANIPDLRYLSSQIYNAAMTAKTSISGSIGSVTYFRRYGYTASLRLIGQNGMQKQFRFVFDSYEDSASVRVWMAVLLRYVDAAFLAIDPNTMLFQRTIQRSSHTDFI